jgi:hypothetical protein
MIKIFGIRISFLHYRGYGMDHIIGKQERFGKNALQSHKVIKGTAAYNDYL